MKTFHSFSSKETEKFGAAIARGISDAEPKEKKDAIVFALRGDLGAGKTTFVNGFFRGLGIKRRTKSPTFIIMRKFSVRSRKPAKPSKTAAGRRIKNIYHIDAYRLKQSDAFADFGFKAVLSDPENVILIEWPENVKGIIPRGARRLEFRYGKKENERIIKEL